MGNRFNLRHFMWLYTHRYVGTLPMELAPFPFPPATDAADERAYYESLREDMIRWGYLQGRSPATENWVAGDGPEVLNPEVHKLLTDLAGHFGSWKLGGVTLVHSLKTNDTEKFIEDFDTVDIWGLRHAVRDVPRAPFVIAVTESEIITAVARNEALLVSRRDLEYPPAREAGRALLDMLDPKREWEPWQGPVTMLPMEAAMSLAQNESTRGVVDTAILEANEESEPDRYAELVEKVEGQRDAIRHELVSESGVGYSEASVLAELATKPVSSMTQAIITYPSSSGMHTPKGLAIGVTFIEGEGVMISYPIGSTEATRTIIYAPGTEAHFTEAVESLLEMAVPDAETLHELTGHS